MTRTRYKIYHDQQPHFLTMTVVNWIPLFSNPEIVLLLLESLRFAQKERGVIIYAYVIMKHHLHMIASSPGLTKSVKEFKPYTARRIIDYLKERNSVSLLARLRGAKLPYKINSEYQLWQEGSHPEEIFSEKMMIQKIKYIHNNPVRQGYVDEPKRWQYSSARDYEGERGLLDICTDWRVVTADL